MRLTDLHKKVDVIIPIYNRKHLLERTINSVLNQTYPHFNLYLVNDGSTEDISSILQLFKDPRIILLNHSYNRGASAARNTAIKASKGEYIAFLDSDDEWFPEKLEKQIQFLEDNNLTTCCTRYYLNRQVLSKYEEQSLVINTNHEKNYLLKGCLLSPGSTLVTRRSVFEKNGLYDESLLRFEDWDWLIRHNQSGFKVDMLDEALATVNTQSKPTLKILKKPIRLFQSKHLNNLSLKESLILRSTLNIELSSAAFYEKKIILSAYYLFLSFLYYPFRSFKFFKKIIRNGWLFIKQ